MNQKFGRYRLLERLGKGGMAEVFKAKSFGVEGFEKVLVVKRILPDLARNQRFVEMFVHEAKLAVRLSHANIVQAFDLGKVDSEAPGDPPSYFIAMEYVAGLDVTTLLGRVHHLAQMLPVGMCLFIASEIAKGLDHAHRRRDDQHEPLGIVHRDVSPQNVLLSWEGEVKLTDFGIAKARDLYRDGQSGVRDGRLAGKAAYMSPEQARGEPVDARSDIFSLGVLLYELLTGANPFRMSTPGDTLERVKAGVVPAVHTVRPEVGEELSAIVAKAMAPDLSARFDAAGKLHDEILAYMYASGTRFSANDLIEFLAAYREAPGDELDMADIVEEGSPSDIEATPAEVPELMARTPAAKVSTRLPVLSYAASIGERREVTAVVVRLSAGPRVADSLRSRVKDTLARYGARLMDESRDSLVCLFGLGDADGRDTETAVRCALVVLRQLSVGRVRPSAGVHTGRVQLHDSGEPARDATYEGVVDIATKLASAAEGRCVVSNIAGRHVRNLFHLEEPTDAEPGGLGMMVGDLRTPDDALRRFVGREEEHRQVGKILAAAARRRLRIVTIRGQQGIGKSRFVNSLERRLRRRGYNIGFYLATCPPLGRDMPLSGMTAMLRVLCGVEEGDAHERIEAVEPRLRALGLTDEERGAVLGQLGASSVEMVGPSVPPLRAAFARMLQRLSEDRVHAFVWDDAQWLDDETMDVLSASAQRLETARAVLMLSTRSFEDHALSAHPSHSYVDLREMEDGDLAQLIAVRAGLKQAPPDLVAFCKARAGGHPLFVEELVKELIETGALDPTSGMLVKSRLIGDIAAPRPLRSLLATRVARLDPSAKAVLHAAATLGDPAHIEVLSTMLGLGLKQSESAIAMLEERGMLRRAGPSTSNMASPLLREVVLESIAPETRRELHGAAAVAYERVLGAQVESLADRVAVHMLEAGERHRAARLFAMSGKRRIRSGQFEGSVPDLLRALAYVDVSGAPVEELLDWISDLRVVLNRVRAAPSVLQLLQRVLPRIDAAGTERQHVVARIDGAAMLGAVHMFDDAIAMSEEALSKAGSQQDLRQLALLTQGSIHGMRGEFGAAIEACEAMGPVTFEGPTAYRHALLLAQALGASGDKLQALSFLERATELSDPHDLGGAVERAKMRALICHFSADFREAAEASHRGVELARSAGLSYEIALGLHNLGDSLLWIDEFGRSHAAFQQSLAVAEQYGYARLARHDRMYLTYLEGYQGAPTALEDLRALVREADDAGLTWDALNGRFLLGALAFRRKDADFARRELERVRILARECQSHLLEKSAIDMLAQLG